MRKCTQIKLVLMLAIPTLSTWYLHKATSPVNWEWLESESLNSLPPSLSFVSSSINNDDDDDNDNEIDEFEAQSETESITDDAVERTSSTNGNSQTNAISSVAGLTSQTTSSSSSSLLSSVSNFFSSASQSTSSSTQKQQEQQQQSKTIPTHNQTQPPEHAPFPRWTGGIDLVPLIDFVELALHKEASLFDKNQSFIFFPETPYIIRASGITTSNTLRNRHGAEFLRGRVEPSEALYVRALQQWKRTPHQWPNITRILKHHKNGSFPIVAWYGDFRECNYHNWEYNNESHSLPLFTTCGHIDCQHAWPQPTYRTILDSNTSAHWDKQFRIQAKTYPWSKKRKQVLWRGSLTGSIDGGPETNIRWVLARLAHTTHSKLWNIGLHRIPPRHKDAILPLHEVGGLKASVPRSEFAHYRAILDIDGNSWSSRFGRLLCDNSIVLKVEPHFVDLFHFQQRQGRYELQPGKHYLPVHYNLSNLMEQTQFVMNPRNNAVVQSIIRNAQQWCRDHLNPNRLAEDVLDLWEAYISHLDTWRPDWLTVWQREEHRWLVPAFEHVPLPIHKQKRLHII
jgi:hypothetical protein